MPVTAVNEQTQNHRFPSLLPTVVTSCSTPPAPRRVSTCRT
jgi:hypothetical protein